MESRDCSQCWCVKYVGRKYPETAADFLLRKAQAHKGDYPAYTWGQWVSRESKRGHSYIITDEMAACAPLLALDSMLGLLRTEMSCWLRVARATAFERDCFELHAIGNTYGEIAADLNVDVRDVRRALRRLDGRLRRHPDYPLMGLWSELRKLQVRLPAWTRQACWPWEL